MLFVFCYPVDGIWSAPTQFGDIPNWRMGHKSVYVPELNTVYVHGGYSITRGNVNSLHDLYAYNPVDHVWRSLATSRGFLGYHSLVALGGVLVAFGGTSQECFQDQVLFYNICKYGCFVCVCVCVGCGCGCVGGVFITFVSMGALCVYVCVWGVGVGVWVGCVGVCVCG